MAEPTPTPAEFQQLAARVEHLAGEIDAAQRRLRDAEDEPTQRVGYRLDDGSGWLRQVAGEIRDTADDLARIRTREQSENPCRAQWGACPEHGNTLASGGGQSWCRAPGCGRRWDWDRHGLPCTEQAAFRVTGSFDDPQGTVLCTGHTLDARERLVGATTRALEG